MDWQEAVRGLAGEKDFSAHWRAWNHAASTWTGEGPMPAWVPTDGRRRRANVTALANRLELAGYNQLHAWSCADRDAFWAVVAQGYGITTDGPVRTGGVEDPSWFPGCRWNAADLCFRHDPESLAVRLRGETDGGQGKARDVTRRELKAMADAVSHGLLAQGLQPGDRVGLYMPMDLDCVAAYLGIIQAGMAVVSIADSFAAEEVAARLRIADAAALVVRASYRRGGKTIDLLAKARAAKARRLLVIATGDALGQPRPGETAWEDVLRADAGPFTAVSVPPDTASNILFSSGTTGDPKAIVWTHLTPLKAAMDGCYHQDIHEGDVVCWPTNIGWMMGPWLIYAAMANGAAVALYEGLPSTVGFLESCNESQVTMLGVVPALVRAWREAGAAPGSLRTVQTFSSTGEASNVHDQLFLMSLADYRAPVIEYCGGTEIGGGHVTGTVVQPQAPAAFSTPALGIDFVVLDEAGRPVAPGGSGEIFLIPPSIGLSQRLLNRDHHEEYYADTPRPPETRPDVTLLRRHGDEVEVLPSGYWRAQGRADDTMNLGGIKVASIELERILDRHPAIHESAAVGIPPPDGGAERLVVFAVTRGGEAPALRRELQDLLRNDLNPLFRIHDVVLVPALPRTASNKVVRRALRKEYKEALNAA